MFLRDFGAVFQNAYIVEDLEQAANHWAQKCGVGPFAAYSHHKYDSVIYRGEETGMDISLAFAYAGDFQVELVQVHDTEAPSAFADALKKNGYGLHHVGLLSENFEKDIAAFESRGLSLLQRNIDVAGVEAAFIDSDNHPGGVIELLRATPELTENLNFLKAVAEQWDGKDSLMYL